MENKPVQFSAQVDNLRTLKDGGLKITIESQELPSDEKTLLFGFANKQIWAVFKETEIKPEEIEIKNVPLEFKNDKYPSQRLRAVLYIYWEQNYATKGSFELFYKDIMEKIINQYKEKLS